MENGKLKTVTGATLLAAVVTLVNIDWGKFFASMEALPGLITKLTAVFPLDFWSFVLAVLAAGIIWSVTYLHREVCPSRPHSCSDVASVLAGMAALYVQAMTPMALLMGFMAGCVGLLVARIGWSIFAKPKVPQ